MSESGRGISRIDAAAQHDEAPVDLPQDVHGARQQRCEHDAGLAGGDLVVHDHELAVVGAQLHPLQVRRVHRAPAAWRYPTAWTRAARPPPIRWRHCASPAQQAPSRPPGPPGAPAADRQRQPSPAHAGGQRSAAPPACVWGRHRHACGRARRQGDRCANQRVSTLVGGLGVRHSPVSHRIGETPEHRTGSDRLAAGASAGGGPIRCAYGQRRCRRRQTRPAPPRHQAQRACGRCHSWRGAPSTPPDDREACGGSKRQRHRSAHRRRSTAAKRARQTDMASAPPVPAPAEVMAPRCPRARCQRHHHPSLPCSSGGHDPDALADPDLSRRELLRG